MTDFRDTGAETPPPAPPKQQRPERSGQPVYENCLAGCGVTVDRGYRWDCPYWDNAAARPPHCVIDAHARRELIAPDE